MWRTAGWTYLRFHEGTATPRPCYGARALESWARRLCETWGRDADAWVYFNNDPRACAPANAVSFAQACERLGMRVGRATEPATDEAARPGGLTTGLGDARAAARARAGA